MAIIDDILRFWFEEHGKEDWYKKSDEFDAKIRDRFLSVYEQAAAGGLQDWRDTPSGCLALCLVLDQFPRNLFRNDPRAFATDAMARALTRHVLDRGFDRDPAIDGVRRMFFYLPLEHGEDIEDQRLCLDLVRERIGDEELIDYAERHLRIVERFGRFPHRNAVLGRDSTEEEIEFLKQPGSSF